MKKIPIKSGGSVFILEHGEIALEGEACFSEAEYEYAKRLAKGFREPEELKTFWENVVHSKRECTTFTVYDLFPEVKEHPPLYEYVGGIIEDLKSKGILK